MPYAIDLFCGAGGFSEGLLQAGFDIVFSSDISEMVEKTYTNRHRQLGLIQGENTWFKRADIKDLTGDAIRRCISELKIFSHSGCPEIDLIVGGPSCQGFSQAGMRNKSDPRNVLFREYVRLISEIKPKYVLLENVEGFMSMQFYSFTGFTGKIYPDGSVTPDILRSELALAGYESLTPRILNAADFGVPQQRRRVIFIAYRKGLQKPKYPEPVLKPEQYLSLSDAISDLSPLRASVIKDDLKDTLTPYQSESRRGRTPDGSGKPISVSSPANMELSNQTAIVRQRCSLFRQGENTRKLRMRIVEEGIDISDKPELIKYTSAKLSMTEAEVIELFKSGAADADQIDILLTKKNMKQRWSPDKPASTIVTIADDFIHPWEDRTFTVRELARLQSFDDSFEFLGKRSTGGRLRKVEVPQFTQVGNAVPPLLAKALALKIKEVL